MLCFYNFNLVCMETVYINAILETISYLCLATRKWPRGGFIFATFYSRGGIQSHCCGTSAISSSSRPLGPLVLSVNPHGHLRWRGCGGAVSSCSSSSNLRSSRWIVLSRSPTSRWYSAYLALFTPFRTLMIESMAKRTAFSTMRSSSARRSACSVPVPTTSMSLWLNWLAVRGGGGGGRLG